MFKRIMYRIRYARCGHCDFCIGGSPRLKCMWPVDRKVRRRFIKAADVVERGWPEPMLRVDGYEFWDERTWLKAKGDGVDLEDRWQRLYGEEDDE